MAVRRASGAPPLQGMSIDVPCAESPRVSVIVVATSSSGLLHACLRSIAQFGPAAIPFETIVVLNEADQSAEAALRATVIGVRAASSPVNLGFAGAGNLGRSLARGEYLLLLHDDVEVEAGWMEALVQAADAHPEAGAVGGKVLYPDGRLQNAGMILWRDAGTSPPWVGAAPAPTAFDHLRAVDYCGTSSLLVRTAAWDAVGGLNEDLYPVYYVDVDLGMALRRLGFVVLYQPASRIRHHQSASSTPRFRKFAARRNGRVFIEKWRKDLEEHEPAARNSPAAVERAMARAEAFGEERRRKGPPAIAGLPSRAAFDPLAQVSRHYEKSRACQKAYIEHLTEALERAEADLKRAEEQHQKTADRDRSSRPRFRLLRRLAGILAFGKRAV
jgi:GT2 family glycosyltransferase